AESLETWLTDRLVERLGGSGPAGSFHEAPRSIGHVASALRELAHDYYVTATITREEFLATRGQLEHHADVATASGRSRADRLRGRDPREIRRALAKLDARRRREVLAAELDRLVVLTAIGPRK